MEQDLSQQIGDAEEPSAYEKGFKAGVASVSLDSMREQITASALAIQEWIQKYQHMCELKSELRDKFVRCNNDLESERDLLVKQTQRLLEATRILEIYYSRDKNPDTWSSADFAYEKFKD